MQRSILHHIFISLFGTMAAIFFVCLSQSVHKDCSLSTKFFILLFGNYGMLYHSVLSATIYVLYGTAYDDSMIADQKQQRSFNVASRC